MIRPFGASKWQSLPRLIVQPDDNLVPAVQRLAEGQGVHDFFACQPGRSGRPSLLRLLVNLR